MVCVQVVVEKKSLLVQFKDGQKKEMSSCSLVFLCSKEEVDMDQPLSNFPKKRKGFIVDYLWGSRGWITLNAWKKYIFICFNCLYFVKYMLTDL